MKEKDKMQFFSHSYKFSKNSHAPGCQHRFVWKRIKPLNIRSLSRVNLSRPVWFWPLTYPNESFIWRIHSLRVPTVPIYFEIHPKIYKSWSTQICLDGWTHAYTPKCRCNGYVSLIANRLNKKDSYSIHKAVWLNDRNNSNHSMQCNDIKMHCYEALSLERRCSVLFLMRKGKSFGTLLWQINLTQFCLWNLSTVQNNDIWQSDRKKKFWNIQLNHSLIHHF